VLGRWVGLWQSTTLIFTQTHIKLMIKNVMTKYPNDPTLKKWKHTLKVATDGLTMLHSWVLIYPLKIHTEANASRIQFNSPLYYFIIHFMTDWQCTICGMWLILMKWKHTLKVAKWQTHHASFMTHDYINHFDISINTTKGKPTKISHIPISHNFHQPPTKNLSASITNFRMCFRVEST
jgi:hypothetical protein